MKILCGGGACQVEELAGKVQGLERDVEERIEIKMQVGGGGRCEGCVGGGGGGEEAAEV